MLKRGKAVSFAIASCFAVMVAAGVAHAQNPFDALRRAAEQEAQRQAQDALRRATQPPAQQPQQPQQQPNRSSAPPQQSSSTPAPAGGVNSPVPFDYNAPWVVPFGARDRDPPDSRDAAAQAEFPSSAPCRWLPTQTYRSPFAPVDAITTAEANALRQNIERVRDFFANDPKFATPPGLCMFFQNGGSTGRLEGGYAIQGQFMIGAWPGEWLYRRNGRIVFDGEISHIVGKINTMPEDQNNGITTPSGRWTPARSERLRVRKTHQGFPVYLGGDVVIALNDRPLYRPVSFERMARWVLSELDRKQYEQTTSASMEAIRNRARAVRSELTASLARMSAEERAAPGCFVAQEVEFGERTALVVTPNDSRCSQQMVEPNPDYFDRSLPRSAIQLIIVRDLPSEPPRGGIVGVYRAGDKMSWMNQAIFYGADWRAFRQQVMQAR